MGTERININKTKSIRCEIKTTKTKAGIREIELTSKADEALLDQKQFTNASGDVVFFNPFTLKPWSKPDVFRRYWVKLLDEANIKHRNPHQMRHTFISYMLTVGNRPEMLYRMVGHQNTEMIYRVYGKFIKGETKGKQLLI